MKTFIKIALLLAIVAGLIYHFTWYRGYFAVGGEIFIPVVIAIMLFGGEKNGKRKKQSRSHC